jgi:dolichyl-phosphate-mannose-protein mannosyltransferase
MRHEGTNGGYLHSHDTNYKTGSQQQQVWISFNHPQITCYPFHDKNSLFIIRPKLETVKVDETTVVDGNSTTKRVDTLVEKVIDGFVKIKTGSVVRLLHKATNKYLHSHDKRAPVSDNEHHNEVSGYRIATPAGGDTNDHWIVEVEGGGDLHAINSRFALKHVNTGCKLFSHNVKLPEWLVWSGSNCLGRLNNRRLLVPRMDDINLYSGESRVTLTHCWVRIRKG